jgi:hypothetical protein
MGDIIPIRGSDGDRPDEDFELIADLSRFAEGVLDEQTIRTKYHGRFDDEAWDKLGGNPKVVKAITLERHRRIRDGSAARERAQILFAGTPEVLGGILHGSDVSPRNKIESAKEIRAIAATGPESMPAEARFIIQINMGSDHVENYSKSIKINPLDNDPFNPTPPEVLAAIAAKKDRGDGGEYL